MARNKAMTPAVQHEIVSWVVFARRDCTTLRAEFFMKRAYRLFFSNYLYELS